MSDTETFETEALTALRHYQESVTHDLQQLLLVAQNDDQKKAVERLWITTQEALNVQWQFQRALARQHEAVSAAIQTILKK